jgi:EsV-1-7 cysteine-rich motif
MHNRISNPLCEGARVGSLLWCVFTQVSITPDRQYAIRQGKQKAKYQRCLDPACTGIVASFGFESDKRRVRCAAHIEEGMICLAVKQCEDPTCYKRASFGQSDTKVSDAQTACAACC